MYNLYVNVNVYVNIWLKPGIERWGLRMYARCKDDITTIADTDKGYGQFKDEYFKGAKPDYEIKLDDFFLT